jgi:hypothetical protein
VPALRGRADLHPAGPPAPQRAVEWFNG